MNKFCEIREGTIRGDLNFIKKLNFNNKKLDENIWTKFRLNSKSELEENKTNELQKKFSSHPKRLFSETDTSVCTSPRRINLSSSDSNINLERTETFVYEVYEKNKLKIKNARKKLHKKLTQINNEEPYHFELNIGDSTSVSPRPNVPGKRSVNFEIDLSEKNKSTKTKSKQNAVVAVPSKKLVPSKPATVNSSRKNIITDSVFEKKFKVFVEKSLHTISDIRNVLERGIAPPDGEEDMSRRIIRVKEFSNRFSRNYLYPLARQLDDLSKLDTEDISLNHKLLSSYQVILNGLQAYHNHLPTSFGTCSSDKLKLLLKHLLELCAIHSKLTKQPDENGFSDFIDTFKLNAELTMQKIEDHFSAISTDSVLKSNTTKVSLVHYGAPKTKLNNNGKKNKIEKRLSMYSVSASFRRDPNWKKAVECLAKKKLNVKSRYKTATFRHRPPVEKDPQILSLPSKCKLFCKKSSSMLKRTPVTTPVDEDAIPTMVQLEEEKVRGDTGDEGSAKDPLNHEEIVVKLLQLVLDNNQRKTAEREQNVRNDEPSSADKQIADILERLRNEGNVDTLQKILDGLQKKDTQQEVQLQLQVVTSQSSLDEGGVKKRKEPIVTITGEKNAKLICIKDENSIIETEDDPEPENKDCQTKEETCPKPVSPRETQTDTKSKEKVNRSTHRTTKTVKMNRLPKSSKYLQMLPKNYAVNIIQYKLDFHKNCKMNPMYRRTTNVEPWMLMGKISDEILDYALLGVASEIEINDIVQKIYESELQL